MDSNVDISQAVGRFHVVLLHLPIGFLVLLAALELISMRKRAQRATAANRYILGLTVPITILSAGCGWLLAEGGGYDAKLLFLHRWTGVSVAVASIVLWWVHCRGWISVYRALILATAGLTLVTGHFGGSLTHGRDYLTRHLTLKTGDRPPAPPPSTEGVGFASVEPILAEYCSGCHGPEKSKGELRTDSLEALLAGGDSGPAIVPGDPEASLLLKRISLPMDDDDHMPPDGKPQPTATDLERLRQWIAED